MENGKWKEWKIENAASATADSDKFARQVIRIGAGGEN